MAVKNKNAFLIHHSDEQRAIIAEWLTDAGYQVETYMTGREFMVDRDRHKAGGFVLVSVKLLDTSGIDLVAELRKEPRFTAVLLATPQTAPAVTASELRAIFWPFDAESLTGYLEFLQTGGTFTRKELAASFKTMTERELDVIRGVAEGLKSKEIAWKLGISVKTIEAHRGRIMDKTRARDVGELVAMWRQWER